MIVGNSSKDYDEVYVERAITQDQKLQIEAFLYKQKKASLVAGIEIGVGVGLFIIAGLFYVMMVTFNQYNSGANLSLWEYVFIFSMLGTVLIITGLAEEFHSRSKFQRSLY